jgi:hypothetical protein
LLACVIGSACSSAGHPGATGNTGGEEETGGSGPAPTGGSKGTGGAATGGSSGGGTGGESTNTGGATGGSGGATGGSGGEGGASPADAGPPGGGGSGVPPGQHIVYVLHDSMAGGSATDPSRKSLMDILNSMHDSHGVVVKMADSVTSAAQMSDASLIIVGPNASMFNHHPAPDLKTTTIPLIVSKDGNTTEIGLGNVVNTPAIYDTIKIIKNDHPLAAGLPLGNVKVNTTANAQRMIRIQNVGPDAIKIAVSLVDNNSYSIVGYEKGATMANGFKAPAKRMGLFWHRPAAATPDGEKLVKAAVDWMLRP